jgi:hypothetical protein
MEIKLQYFGHHKPFMTYHGVVEKSNSTGVTRGTGTAYRSEAPKFNSMFLWEFMLLHRFCVVLYRYFVCSLSYSFVIALFPSCDFWLPLWYQTFLSQTFSYVKICFLLPSIIVKVCQSLPAWLSRAFWWPKQFHVFSAFYKTDLKKFEISFIGNFYYI